MLKRLLVGAAVALLPTAALAQQTAKVVSTCGTPGQTLNAGMVWYMTVDTTGAMCANVSVTATASISGYAPGGSYATPLSVTTAAGARVALPGGAVVVVYNTGTVPAYVQLGNSSVQAAVSNDVIQPNSWIAFTVGSNTYLSGITASGSTTLNISGGTGLPTGAGGGGGGSGSGGGTSSNFASAFPSAGTALGVKNGANMVNLTADGSGNLNVDVAAGTVAATQSGTWNVTNISGAITLPTGASTLAAQTTANGSLATIAGAVSGSAMNAAESGTWTVQPGNTPNSTAWLVTGTGGTFPATQSGTWNVTNVSGTVSLPTGAATAANQTNVQSSLGTSATTGVTVQGSVTGVALPANITQFGGNNIATGTGTGGVGVPRVTVSSDSVVGATESGTWTVQPGNSANTTAWLVTGTGGTFPATESGTWNITNVSGTVSLPTGASTAANQTNVQSAPGAAAGTALTIQGNASGIAIPVTGSLSASFSGYTPGAYVTPLTVTTAPNTRTALPAGNTVVVYNVGANTAFTTIGNTSVSATTGNDAIFPNCWISYAVGGAVDIAAITSSGTTTLNLSGGAGLPTGGCSNVVTGTVTANQGTGGASAWLVNGNGGTFPSTQSGTWTVQPGNTANTTAWLVTGTGGTFPATESGTWNITNISGTISLPTGAATAANQATAATIGSATSGETGHLAMGAVTTAAPTYTNAQSNVLSLDTAGNLRVTATGTVAATESGTWTVQPGNTANTTAWLVTGTGGTFPSTQSGTWTVQPGNTPNTTAWLVTGSGGTFPATQGAGNAANPWTIQGLGTAGVSSGGVLSIQGIAGGTAVPISGTVNASIGNFAPTPDYRTLAVSTSTNRTPAPSGTSVIIYNIGSVDAYVTVGGSSVNAATTDDVVKAGGWMQFTMGANTYVAGITAAGATTLTISGGAGIAAGSAFGSSPIATNITQLAGTALGAPVAWGSTPSGNVIGVNANVIGTAAFNLAQVGGVAVTNTPTAVGTAGTGNTPTFNDYIVGCISTVCNANGVAVAANSAPVVGAVSAATVLQTGATGNGNGAALTVNGYNGAIVYVNCTVACSGGTTINFEGQTDGSNFFALSGMPLGGGSPATTATTTGAYAFNVVGLQQIRARISNYSAGTITATAIAGAGSPRTPITQPTNLTQINGTATSSVLDGSGYMNVDVKTFPAGSGFAIQDNTAFTQGTTYETTVGCFNSTSYSAATSGRSTAVQCNNAGQLIVTGSGAAGTAAAGVMTIQGIASMTPVAGNITQIAGSTNGVTTWGTAPTGASVIGANVNCLSGCGGSGGTSISDGGSFTAGSTSLTPVGGVIGAAAVAAGVRSGAFAMDTGRNLFTNTAEWAGSALGAMANYGTSPGAVLVPGVNAFVTNIPAVTQSGTWNVGLSTGANTVGKVDILGNAAATLDIAQGGGTAATNALQIAGVYNSVLPTLSPGQGGAIQLDSSARPIIVGAGTAGTPIGGVVSVQGASGGQAVAITGTITANAGSGNMGTNLVQISGSSVSTAATGIQKVGLVGASGSALDATLTANTAPANGLGVLLQYNSSLPTLSNTQTASLQGDSGGRLMVNLAQVGTNTLTSVGTAGSGNVPTINDYIVGCVATVCLPSGVATAANSAPVVQAVSAATVLQTGATGDGNGTALTVSGYSSGIIYVNCTVACSGGTTINFEGQTDGTNFFAIQGTPVGGGAGVTTATTTGAFAFNLSGLQQIRARISGYSAGTITATAVAGSGGGSGGGGSGSSGAITAASGAYASGSIASGAFVAGSISDGAMVTLGTEADVANTSTTSTPATVVGILKEISAKAQNPAPTPITIASAQVASGAISSGAFASGALASGSVASGAYASGSIADGAMVTIGTQADAANTSTTSTPATVVGILKEISAKAQAPASTPVTGTFYQATQPVSVASGQIASGAVASGAIASGAVASGAFASGSVSDGAIVTLGAKGDAANAATDTTPVSIMAVLKEISAKEQAPASTPVTGTFYQATQPVSVASGQIASGAIASGAVASGAFASGSVADGAVVTLGAKADAASTATDTTAVSVMSVLKEISAKAQSPAALPANQSINNAQINGVTPLMGNGTTGTGSQRVTIASDNTAFSVNAQPVAVAAGGMSVYHKIAAANDNHVVIKAGAGTVYSIDAVAAGTGLQYVRLYDATTGFNGCNSATNLIWGQQVPAAATAAGVGAGYVIPLPPAGIAFATGISICITGAVADTDVTNAATTTIVNVGYK